MWCFLCYKAITQKATAEVKDLYIKLKYLCKYCCKARVIINLDKKGVRGSFKVPEGNLRVSMFFTLKRTKVVKPLSKELDSFISTRHGQYGNFSTSDRHREYIRKFIDVTGIKSVEEIDSDTVEMYLRGIRETENTEFAQLSAGIAIRQFLAYMNRKEIKQQRGRVGRPPKEERNLEMVALRKFDKKKWSIQVLATRYGITKRAVWEILERYKDMLEKR